MAGIAAAKTPTSNVIISNKPSCFQWNTKGSKFILNSDSDSVERTYNPTLPKIVPKIKPTIHRKYFLKAPKLKVGFF